jgi:pilus assembly protein Flp/PilA
MFEYLKALIYTHLPMPKSEKGQDLAEYALLLGLIALVVILAVTLLGRNISTIFSNLAANIATWVVP